MTGHRIIASVACSYAVAVLGMTPANAADATRTRSGSSAVASAASASSEPGSFTAYRDLVMDGGALTGGPAMLGAKPRAKDAVGGGKNGTDCAREPFPCGVYEIAAEFEAEHGPFSEALGNLEDWEATNVNAGQYCSVGNPPGNCAAHGPGTGSCAGNSLDAGDIQKGYSWINSPFRNTNNELLLLGIGFNGNASKLTLPNYFGDSHDITFPNAAVPTGCQTTSPGPNVFGTDLIHPFGTTGAIVTITLENARTQEYDTNAQGRGRFGMAGLFVGFCCEAPIASVKILDIDGLSIGTDNSKFGQAKGACPVSFPPLSLEDINCALEAIEAKLDTGGPGGGGGGCDFCEAQLDAAGAGASTARRDRDKACRHELKGQFKQAEQTRCRMAGDIDTAEANGSITPADATALRACLAAEQASRSDELCN